MKCTGIIWGTANDLRGSAGVGEMKLYTFAFSLYIYEPSTLLSPIYINGTPYI